MTIRTRAVLLAGALPALLLGGAAALIAGWAPRLPDPMALHWGLDGVDRVGSLTEHVVPLAIIAVVLCLPAAVIAIRSQGSGRRMLVGLSAGVGALMAGIAVGTTAVQVDVVDAYAVPSPGAAVVLPMVVAIAIGTLAGIAAGPDPFDPARGAVPADAARLAVPDDGAAVWTRALPPAPIAFPAVVIGVLLAIAIAIGATTGDWWLLLVAGLITALVLLTLGWRIQADRTGLTLRGSLGWPRYHVPAQEIVRADVVDEIRPLGEFGGWGIRVGRHGTLGFVTRRGEGIAVERTGGRRVVVTVADAARAAALLNTAADRARADDEADGRDVSAL